MSFSIRIIALIVFAAGSLPAYGQSAAAGALEGSITDTAGQRMADVTVKLLNAATEERHAAKTDASGAFRFSLLPPGTYRVEFAREGFKTARMAQLTLNASEVPVLETVLEPGDPAVTVECPCHLRAVAPSTGTLVDQKTITAVPLNTRNFTQVLSMSSGSVASVNNAGTLGRGTPSVNVNGNTTAGGYTVDGAYAPSTVPNPDAISEFKIQTSQNDAMFGAMVPNTNLMTKRGENSFHGNMWEFLRNDVFNANAFFRNATGQPKPNLKQNQFGATGGGPVKRNKLFFFASYQGTRQVNGLDNTSVSNLILPGLTDDRSAATLAGQFCPGNHASDSRYQTYAGGRQLDCNNQNSNTTTSINPVALRLLQMKGSDGRYMIPTPQTMVSSGSNAGLGFSSYSMPSTYKEHHYLGNGDYLMSPGNTLSGRVFAATVNQLRTFGSPGGYPGAPIVPGFGSPQALSATDVATSLRLNTQGEREHCERSGGDVHAQSLRHQQRRRAGRVVSGYDGSRSAVPEASGDHRAGTDGFVPCYSAHFPTTTTFRRALSRWAIIYRGSMASSACAAAVSSSTSTTGARTQAARAERSRFRRSRIFWSG